MNLKNVCDESVLHGADVAAHDEREATTRLLYHLIEIENRRLFAKRGFSSLFAYCVGQLKMSEPQADRRIKAARALREFPEIGEKIESGVLSVTTVSQAQTLFKKEIKAGLRPSKEKKSEIFMKIERKSTREVEKILLSHSALPPESVVETVKMVSSEITEIRFGADQELMRNLSRLKELWGISSMAELTEKMASIALKHCDPLIKSNAASTTAPGVSRSRYIHASVRRAVWRRDMNCTYIDKYTGHRCCSRYRLQLDHIVPFALGGPNTLENLRLRCFAHNQLHAMDVFGPEVLRFAEG
jgi:hypothetical protein